jgi:hypothetical protein
MNTTYTVEHIQKGPNFHRSLITDIAAWSNSEGYAVNVILESSASKEKV